MGKCILNNNSNFNDNFFIDNIIIGGNAGGIPEASITVNSKIAIVAGSGDGYDNVGGNLYIYIDGNEIKCTDINGTFSSRTFSNGTDKKSTLFIWINNKDYKNNIIEKVKYSNARSDGSSNVIYFNYSE